MRTCSSHPEREIVRKSQRIVKVIRIHPLERQISEPNSFHSSLNQSGGPTNLLVIPRALLLVWLTLSVLCCQLLFPITVLLISSIVTAQRKITQLSH